MPHWEGWDLESGKSFTSQSTCPVSTQKKEHFYFGQKLLLEMTTTPFLSSWGTFSSVSLLPSLLQNQSVTFKKAILNTWTCTVSFETARKIIHIHSQALACPLPFCPVLYTVTTSKKPHLVLPNQIDVIVISKYWWEEKRNRELGNQERKQMHDGRNKWKYFISSLKSTCSDLANCQSKMLAC